MSEYQCYEFQAIDQRWSYSTRARISATSFVNELCLAIILLEMEDGAIPHCGRGMRRHELNQLAPTKGFSA